MRLPSSSIAVLLCLVPAVVACASRPATPQPDAAAPSTTADVASDMRDAEDAAALAARPADVVDARTRPEPHPVIPVGSQLVAYVGPRFITGEEFVPEAKVVLADEMGRVRALMKTMPAPGTYPIVQLPGAVAVAGLHDAHLHLEGIGMARESVDLVGVTSGAQIKQRVIAFVKAHPDVVVVRGRGWDQSRFAGQAFPTTKDLEGAAKQPVWLRRVDGHAGLANAALLALAGITKDTPDPAGGRILRDAAGRPTGVLVDNAMDLVESKLPGATDVEHERWLVQGLSACADAGLVAVHDMGVSVASARILARLDDEHALPVRVFAYLDGTDDAAYDLLTSRPHTDMLSFMGVKLYADGALGSRGAALLADYSDEPGQRGLLVTDEKTLEERVQRVHAKGFQAAIHAIGDRANRIVVDVLTRNHVVDIRDRVEHAQIVSPDDIARFYEPRITASMQPTHATSDMRWAQDRVGADRLVGAYAWRTFLQRGVGLAFGSDAPVEDERPQFGIYAAITRQDAEGHPPGGWLPSQKLTQAEALQAFARGAAWAVNMERHMGALTPGMFFDVTLFDVDVVALTDAGHPDAWLRVKPVGIVVGGKQREARAVPAAGTSH